MKRLPLLLSLLAILFGLGTRAQVFYNMADFELYGTLAPDASNHYSRLPDSLQNKVRKPLWELGQNCAGLSLRFATDASTIKAKWKSLNGFGMNHMTPTGVRGLDLYMLMPDSTWTYVGSGRPAAKNDTTVSTIIKDLPRQMREYMLFLSLYDGITDLSIGVDDDAVLIPAQVALPVRMKPIVMYGTSILQGGCATRPGMAHTNILQRMFNREVVNLGFSGNGHLDPEIADIMAACDAAIYVIDIVPNNTAASLAEKLEPFYDIIRQHRPDTPILLVENPNFPRTHIDAPYAQSVKELNGVLRDFYNRMKTERSDAYLYYFDNSEILDTEFEGTVDGQHFTDLGFKHFAEILRPVIKVLID